MDLPIIKFMSNEGKEKNKHKDAKDQTIALHLCVFAFYCTPSVVICTLFMVPSGL